MTLLNSTSDLVPQCLVYIVSKSPIKTNAVAILFEEAEEIQLNRKTWMQVSDTSMSVSVLLKQIIKTMLLYNYLTSFSDTSQIGGKIKINCLV